MSPSRVCILTLGCKVNQCDSDEIARSLAARGYRIAGRDEPADTYIVNTCTVTSTADAKARKLIRKVLREHPEAALIVTGCLAQRDPSSLLELPGVTAVVPNTRKLELAHFLPELQASSHPASHLPPRTRAFLKIQDGCDHQCTYCVVPDARGRPTSMPLPMVLTELRELAESGAQEVVLCGIRLGAYGRDRGDASLARLLQQVRGTSIPRVRLSSVEPMDVDGDVLAETSDHPTLCHHLHLPLQSGDDSVLKAMGRGYTSGDFAGLVGRIRAAWPDAAISTDVMVGFPGETDEQFQRSLDFIRDMAFTRVHVFPYSRRPDTPAAERSDEVSTAAKRERTQEMLSLAHNLACSAAQAWIGKEVSVLFEEIDEKGRLTGHTSHYVRVRAGGPDDWVGNIVEAVPTREKDGDLLVDC
jgi:threonylcarbamoyladenosine tRNA methylthiotransferase MtaB